MMSFESLGVVTEDAFLKALEAPFGGAAKIFRKFDPRWGDSLKYNGKQLKTYILHCQQERTVREVCTVKVEAYDEDHAKQLTYNLDDGEFDWDEADEDTDDFQINKVKELK